MFNKEFLKTLTVMYVEDDESIRTSLGNILKKIFKEVILAEDGQDGLTKFSLYSQNMDLEFDAIISDINMPNMNGLEMAKEIRTLNSEIPIIMTTAHGESNYLMEAIKVNVSGYSLKPIDTKELLLTIQRVCLVKRNQKLIQEKEEELSEYMDLINNVATIVKVDENNIIIHTNYSFDEIAHYEENELVGSNVIITIHPDSTETTYKNMQNNIKKGNSWSGKMKYITKTKEVFYLRATCIPKKDNLTGRNIGYTAIGFLADAEEQEKQETMNKVRQNILAQRQKILLLSKELQNLKKNKPTILSNNQSDASFIKDALDMQRIKSAKQQKQLEHYEKEIATLQNKLVNFADLELEKRKESLAIINELKKENNVLRNNLIDTQSTINSEKTKSQSKYVE
jgi:PAS domain S-box-containing protein